MSLRDAVPYVAAAYLAVLATVIVYLLLIGRKLTRLEGELDAIEQELDRRDGQTVGERAA